MLSKRTHYIQFLVMSNGPPKVSGLYPVNSFQYLQIYRLD